MKFVVSCRSKKAQGVLFYSVKSCHVDTSRLPRTFQIVINVVAKRGSITIKPTILRSVKVKVLAYALRCSNWPVYTHCIKLRLHKVKCKLFITKLSVTSPILRLATQFRIKHILNCNLSPRDEGLSLNVLT